MFKFKRSKQIRKPMIGTAIASSSQPLQADVPTMPPEVQKKVHAAIQAAVDHRMEPTAMEPALLNALSRIRNQEEQGPLIWGLRIGLLGFLNTVFPGTVTSNLYGQIFLREPKGRGAHFDVYDELLDPRFPWVALFNLEGDAVVKVCRLSDADSQHYSTAHPVPTDAAYSERRRLAVQSLSRPNERYEKGLMTRGDGLIIPQQRHGPDWIHDVVPTNGDNPGRFVKIAVVQEQHRAYLYDRGYDHLGGLLTKALISFPSRDTEDAETHPRRRCNLD